MDHILAPRNATTDTWGFEGNPDIYGVGIRAGYYAQALSIWAANFFVPHEARYLHSLNVLFILAMLIGMVYLSSTPSKTYAVEVFLLHQISYVIASVGVTPAYKPKWAWDFRHRLARDGIFLTLDTFSVWFWYVGLSKGMLKPTPSPEGTIVWWMNQGDLFGWIRYLNMALSPPLLMSNALSMANLLLSKLRERRLAKHLSSNGYHELQREMSIYIRRLKATPLDINTTPTAPLLVPATTASPTSDKDYRPGSFSAVSTIVAESSSPISQFPSTSEPSEKSKSSIEAESTPKTPVELKQASSPSPLNTQGPNYLPRLKHADAFLEDFLRTSKYIPDQFAPNTMMITKIFIGIFYVMSLPWIVLRNIPPFFYRILTHKVRLNVILTLFNYIQYLPTHRAYRLNAGLDAAFSHAHYADVDPEFLLLLVKMRLVNRPPPPLTRKERIRDAIVYLCTCLVLIISVELPLWWNYIRNVQVFGYVGQLVPFCLGAGGLVKVIIAFFDQNSHHGRRLKNCKCLEGDEDVEELARLWKDLRTYERSIVSAGKKGKKETGSWEDEDEELLKKCRKFEFGQMTYWFRITTGRLKS